MSDYHGDAYQTDKQVEVQVSRRAPFSQVADWVLLADISPLAKLLYWALTVHLAAGAPVTDQALARILDRGHRDTTPALLAELVDLGAIERHDDGSLTVGIDPPPNYSGPVSVETAGGAA